MMAEAYAHGMFIYARLLYGKRGNTKQHPGPPGWGFSAELTTLPCKIQLGKKKQMKAPTAAVEALSATREEGDKWAS